MSLHFFQILHPHKFVRNKPSQVGHATVQLVTDIYPHMLDEGQKNNVSKFNAELYSKPDLHVEVPNKEPESSEKNIINLLEESPELKQKLKDLLQ